ncbi:sulfotransferase domain-containing protein [Winogradskyella immobilis]|uniref:Sulfotransferase domain-containing protein n=1 Tax=Winogradskyella immobilis TaxID=2816852 RepID=A0ABS8ENW2_9FLAO|nr:sulfotransferase domain-containing protein [Winogradskyella immobilis]MCC1484914.1 sulfotransferase domain-containing protein [Winogradskyella immobilis]MCG0017006.1 sulfotransferase domain-containing protein [Winogradskyella immobilis]
MVVSKIKNTIKDILLKCTSLKSFNNHLISRVKGDEIHIFIACLPKSGSTFLANVLVNITGFEFVQFQPIRGTNDHNIDPSVFYESLNKNTITQLHSKPNESNKYYMERYNIKIIFLYRDIRSSLKSFYNHIITENDKWFMFTVAKEFREWEIEKQFDFLIDLIIPWYINFLTSWKIEVKKKELDILEIDFDDFKNSNAETINKILTFYELDNYKKNIESALDISYSKKEALRFNSVVSKIDYEFTTNQLNKIKYLISYYPELNIKI